MKRKQRKLDKPRHKPPMTDLERAMWTLMCTDDYTVVEQTDDYAVLHYSHNSPPHPRIIIRVEQPSE